MAAVETSAQAVEADRGEDVVIAVTAVTTVLAGLVAATWALAMIEAVIMAPAMVPVSMVIVEASTDPRASLLAEVLVSALDGNSCLSRLVARWAMNVTTDMVSSQMRSSEMTSDSSTEVRITTVTTVTELISSIDLGSMQTIIIVAITDMDTMGVDQILISTETMEGLAMMQGPKVE
jgi:hypothetical protein